MSKKYATIGDRSIDNRVKILDPIEVVLMRDRGVKIKDIAKHFNCTRQNIYYILNPEKLAENKAKHKGITNNDAHKKRVIKYKTKLKKIVKERNRQNIFAVLRQLPEKVKVTQLVLKDTTFLINPTIKENDTDKKQLELLLQDNELRIIDYSQVSKIII